MQNVDSATYDSLTDFIHATRNECVKPGNERVRDEYISVPQNGGRSWYGANCDTGNDVANLILKGWTEGRTKTQSLIDGIDTSDLIPVDMRRRIKRADMGDTLDISAVYAGRWQTAWTLAKRQSAVGPQKVDICVNMLCHGGESPDVLFWRGAAAVALSDLLETAGYMVRLVVGFGGNKSEKVSCRITVKDHDKPMDISTASAILIPGFFRALGHAWIEGHITSQGNMSGISVGQCNTEAGETFLSHAVRSQDTAKAWVAKQIKAVNSRFEQAA